jgi:hypothetical protein
LNGQFLLTRIYFRILLTLSLKLKATNLMIAGSDLLEFPSRANIDEFASKAESMI